MEKKKKDIFYADLLSAEAWVFIAVSVAGLLLHLPHYFLNKIWWAFWKKVEKLKTRDIAQHNSWFLDIAYWVWPVWSCSDAVLCHFNEEDWRQRNEGYLSPNDVRVCVRKPGFVEASGVHPWCQGPPYLLSCCSTFPGAGSPFFFLPSHWGQEDVAPWSWKKENIIFFLPFLVILMGMASMGGRLELAEG